MDRFDGLVRLEEVEVLGDGRIDGTNGWVYVQPL